MIKRIAFSLLCLWTISANAGFATNEYINNVVCSPDLKEYHACGTYFKGVTEALKMMILITKPECKRFKRLSPNMVLAAFEAEYEHLDPEDYAITFLSKYIMDNGGCEKDG